jgi:secondary thiamine-phosphate synthase enzyme
VKTLKIETSHKTELVDITSDVKEVVITSGVKEGICVVFTPHTTASVLLFENVDPKLQRDFLRYLQKVAPDEGRYEHAGGNAAAHIKSSRTGASVSIPVVDGRPFFGEWQGVFFAEFDGPRGKREILVKVIAG